MRGATTGFQGPLQPGTLSPLMEAEVRQLYASQGVLTPADESQLAVPQPVPVKLVAPADFRRLADEQAIADGRAGASPRAVGWRRRRL